jgi:hypothetical protein
MRRAPNFSTRAVPPTMLVGSESSAPPRAVPAGMIAAGVRADNGFDGSAERHRRTRFTAQTLTLAPRDHTWLKTSDVP